MDLSTYILLIFLCVVNIFFYLLWDTFKFTGHTQFYKVIAASKEIVLFHDYGPLLC